MPCRVLPAQYIIAPGPTCVTEGSIDTGRFQSLITSTSGVKADICTLDWATDLQAISRNVFGARRSYELTSAARGPADIVVSVNGVPLPSTAWHFDSITNAVVLDVAPAAGTLIDVSYRTACF